MDININITLGATPALMAALTALTNAVTQATPATLAVPATPAAPVVAEQKPAAKPAKKEEPTPAKVKTEEKKEEPKPAEEPQTGTMSYETFSKIIIPINQKVGPDKMRELIKQFGGERTLRTVPEEKWQDFIDAAKALEGGAA